MWVAFINPRALCWAYTPSFVFAEQPQLLQCSNAAPVPAEKEPEDTAKFKLFSLTKLGPQTEQNVVCLSSFCTPMSKIYLWKVTITEPALPCNPLGAFPHFLSLRFGPQSLLLHLLNMQAWGMSCCVWVTVLPVLFSLTVFRTAGDFLIARNSDFFFFNVAFNGERNLALVLVR